MSSLNQHTITHHDLDELARLLNNLPHDTAQELLHQFVDALTDPAANEQARAQRRSVKAEGMKMTRRGGKEHKKGPR